MYHTTDCGQRFAVLGDHGGSSAAANRLEDCPKVSNHLFSLPLSDFSPRGLSSKVGADAWHGHGCHDSMMMPRIALLNFSNDPLKFYFFWENTKKLTLTLPSQTSRVVDTVCQALPVLRRTRPVPRGPTPLSPEDDRRRGFSRGGQAPDGFVI
jgi:hypothetical protein